MRLEHESPENLKRQVRDIVGKYLDVSRYRVFFFGSRVQGRGNERSDIDIGIQGPQQIPGHIMAEIHEDIENLRTLYKIDVVDFSSVSDDFRREAMRASEPIP